MKNFKYLAVVFILSFNTLFLFSASGTWVGLPPGNGASWTDNGNWSGATYPGFGAGETATFNNLNNLGIDLVLPNAPANPLLDIVVQNPTVAKFVGTGAASAAFNFTGDWTIDNASQINIPITFQSANISGGGTGSLRFTNPVDNAGSALFQDSNIDTDVFLVNYTSTIANSTFKSMTVQNGRMTISNTGTTTHIDEGFSTSSELILIPDSGFGNNFHPFNSLNTTDFTNTFAVIIEVPQVFPLGSTQSLISIANATNLNMPLYLDFEVGAGAYQAGQQVCLIAGDLTLEANFKLSVSSDSPSFPFQFTYENRAGANPGLWMTITTSSLATPLPKELLPSQSHPVYNYLYGNPDHSVPEVVRQLNQTYYPGIQNPHLLGATPTTASGTAALAQLIITTFGIPQSDFFEALLQLTPMQYGAFALVGFQNNIHVANTLSKRMIDTFCMGCIPGSRQLWVEPIGFYYHQNPQNFQRGFDSYTYGVSYGMEFTPTELLHLFGGIGYTHSNLVWYPNFGDAHMNDLYLSLGTEISSSIAFVNFLVQGDFDFIGSNRKIHFPGLFAKASSTHNSYNLLSRLHAGVKPYVSNDQKFFMLLEAQLNYFNLFEESYREIGAGNVDLDVFYKHSVYLQPNATLKCIHEFKSKKICYTPHLFVGWLVNVPLTNANYDANMYNLVTGFKKFSTRSYHEYANQFTFGGEFNMSVCKRFLLSINYEGTVFSKLNTQAVRIRTEWAF